MDNHLTPNKIQRLINIAEDKSYTRSRRLNDDEVSGQRIQANQHSTTNNYESSSGILDIDQIEGLGEFDVGTESLSKSTAFNPGEMTGRSTGTDEINNKTMPMGRHSFTLATITSEMDKQSHEVINLMRHSICNTTNYSFHSKRDLTADEASLVMREAPLPIQPSATQAYFADSATVSNNSNLSVGAYFLNRCPEFGKILGKTDSPDKSMLFSTPSITAVTPQEQTSAQIPPINIMDDSLDCVPVRQSRMEKHPEKPNINNPGTVKNYEKQSFHSAASKFEKANDTYNKAAEHYLSMSKASEAQTHIPKMLNPVASSSFASHRLPPSSKPTDLLIKHMNASLRLATHDTEDGSGCPSENSLSISKIADFLGKESNVSVSAILKYNNIKKPLLKKQPLTELHMNLQEGKMNEQIQVSQLRDDTRKTDAASSAGTINTVISLDKLKPQGNEIPAVTVTNISTDEFEEYKDKKLSTKSKSPSSKSHSTLSTVHENCTSFKSCYSPQRTNKGEVNNTHVPSPNIEYRELDKSVDWHEVLQQKRLKESLAKDRWAEIAASAANGYVGVSCPINIIVTTLSDNWLTAKLQFDNLPNDGKDLTIELPRLPLLLSPGKSEQFTLHLTSNVELDTTLSYSIFLKDASIDEEIEQKGSIEVNVTVPMIQAMSCDGVNKVTFPPIQEKSSATKSLVLLSDCPVDLQLDLSVAEGDSHFTIQNVQEIKKSDVNKVLMDRQGSIEDGLQGKAKSRGLSKQLCRLSNGNAIRVSIKFNAPKLSELQMEESIVTFNSALNVNLIGVNTVLRKVDLIGVVGSVKLIVQPPTGNKLQLTNELTNLPLRNMGSVTGVWVVKFANPKADSVLFKVAPSKFDIGPGGLKNIALCYVGPEDAANEATIIFEDITSGHKTSLVVAGGTDAPKTFPVKTTYNILSFVRAGRKEVSLKNSTNKKIHLRVYIVGDGFSIDLPGMEARGVYSLPFAPSECRTLSIMFHPVSYIPQKANLHLVYDKNSDLSRTVKLFGCATGDSMRWSGLVTYGETALVRAVSREPITLELFNKCQLPAFVCAKVHFNLQFNAVSGTARLHGGERVVSGRARHSLVLLVEWARVERRARDADTTALATVTVLTGAELTRRRILKVLRDESSGEIDTSFLDDHLKVLAGQFEGEDPELDNSIKDFKETKASLNELIGGLHELTAQIVLPQDFTDENTIIISDDTIVEHHTLCD